MSQQQNRSHKVIQYYLDPDMKERAPTKIIHEFDPIKGEMVDVDTGELELNFGTVLQGEAKKIKLYAHNTIEYPIQLEPIIENGEPDLKITRYPPVLREGETAQVDIVFSPGIDRISPLQSGFDFRKIILTKT